MLCRKDLGRGEQRGLSPGVDGGEHGAQRDDGLARADLALQEPVHGGVARHLLSEHLAHLAVRR